MAWSITDWLTPARVPEPEVMEDAAEVESYAEAAAQAYLAALADTLVDQVAALRVEHGCGLDVGCGPGSICRKLARRLPCLRFIGIDRAANMVRAAQKAAAAQGLESRVEFRLGDAARLEFPDASFDLVISNSVLHHLASPVESLNEMARVVRPGGWVLVRDLRRPSRFTFRAHAAWHGRHYTGRMAKLYRSSLRAAYTQSELTKTMGRSALAGGEIFNHRHTHLGILWMHKFQGQESS